MNAPKVLIDTNILIALEDNHEVEHSFSAFLKKCQQFGIKLFVHEASKQDIERDKNIDRRKIILSKIDKFPSLSGIPVPNKDELEQTYGDIRKPNDYVDVLLLHALHKDAVDFLVTQDAGLHKRANSVGASDRIFRLEDAIVWIRGTFDRVSVSLPYIEEKECHQIDRDDDIFQSLQGDYDGFNDWFTKSCVKNHRPCWTINFNDEIAGIAIHKDETRNDLLSDVDCTPSRISEAAVKILKICTFKIKEKYRGEKLGEQLIKQILWWANKNDYNLVYLTVFPKHEYLINLLMQYGFEDIGKASGELFLSKAFHPGVLSTEPGTDPLEYHRQYYPRYLDREGVTKYLIPIQTDYYDTLFPENKGDRQSGLFEPLFESNRLPGNTIRKVYVCHAQIKSIKPGDIVLFFHSKDTSSLHSQTLVTVGIVDGFEVTKKQETLLKLTAKRSVFNSNELAKFTDNDKREVKVINFLLAGHINPSILYSKMISYGIKGPYQSIRRIPDKQFERLNEEIRLDVKTA